MSTKKPLKRKISANTDKYTSIRRCIYSIISLIFGNFIAVGLIKDWGETKTPQSNKKIKRVIIIYFCFSKFQMLLFLFLLNYSLHKSILN